MTKILTFLFLIITLSFNTIECNAFDLKEVLKNASKNSGKDKGSIGDLVGNLVKSDNLSISDMEGNWTYTSPAVSFKSGNLLKKAGGAAIASAAEAKLAPYYKAGGLEGVKLSVKSDSTFLMKVRGLSLSGVITKAPEGSVANFVMKFKAAKKINIGNLETYALKNANGNLELTFDITKLVTLLQKVSSITGNSTVKSISSLLSSYDGICAGFELKPENNPC